MRAVVMAGGGGTRLWPASRSRCPKQFLSLVNGRSLLSATLDLLAAFLPPESILVAANIAHRDLVETHLSPGMRAIYEPAGRGTAPALGLAALCLATLDDDTIVAVPADNWIGQNGDFLFAVKAAARLAGEGGIVAVGTAPERPATEFGYLRPGAPVAAGDAQAFYLAGFTEKPCSAQAAALCAQGCLWNAGVFAFRPDALIAEIGRLQPVLAETLAKAGQAMRADNARGDFVMDETFHPAWQALPTISFEEGVLARHPHQAKAVRGNYRWRDMGGWDAVREAMLAPGEENVTSGDTVLFHSRNCLVRSVGGRLVALVGGENLTVIDTPDALLVLGAGHGQEVRRITDALAEAKRNGLL